MPTDVLRPELSPSRCRVRAALLALALLGPALAACSTERAPESPGMEPASRTGPDAKGPSVGPPAIVLRRFRDPVERVVIGPGGVATGADGGGPLAIRVFTSPERAADLRTFVRAWAPFQVATPVGPLRFEGRGTAAAGPAERRMIVEWARLVAAEAAGERGGTAYGLALAWHRGEADGRPCDRLAVALAGEVRAATCAGGGRERRSRLDAERLARLYSWFDGLRPFQLQADRTEDGAALPVHLLFAGRGGTPAAPGAQREVERFAADLHRELLGPPPAAEPAPAARPRPPRRRRQVAPPVAPTPAPPPATDPGLQPGGQGGRR